jgi:HlyD family secretion protein
VTHLVQRTLLVGLVMVVGVASYTLWPATPDADRERRQARSVSAREMPAAPRIRVAALGRLAPQGDIINVGAPDGDRLTQVLVLEGQQVQAGDILARLDSHAERVAEQQHITSRLAESSARLTAETAYGNALLAESALRIRQLQHLPLLEIQIQEAKVRTLEEEVATSHRDVERLRTLTAKKVAAQQELDRQMLVLRRHELELQGAQSALKKVRNAQALDLELARAQWHTAQASMPKAQRAIELESLRAQLALAAVRVERCLIRAPISGQILKILTRPGEATNKQPIVQMGDTRHMYTVAEVYETDIGLVRVGQQASVTSPALPQALQGTVELIGKTIIKNALLEVDPVAAVDRRVVEVKIRLAPNDLAAQLVNLQVDVAIDVQDR